MNITKKSTTALVAAAVLALALAGCAAPASSEPQASAAPEPALTITDTWVKSAEEGMSAAFGEVTNTSDEDVTIVSATSAASPVVELHETVANETGEMIMRPRAGGFVVPAGGSLSFAPGGNHIMFLDIAAPLAAGEEVTVTLTLSDGSTLTFTAPVKDYSGANETYVGGDMNMDMGN